MLVFAAWIALADQEQGAPAPQAPPPQTAASKPAKSPAPPEPDEQVGGVTVKAPRAEPEWAKTPNVDPTGEFAREKTPYYERPLDKGCRLALPIRCKLRF